MSMSATFARYLPPPQFLTMPSLGVDISDTSLKYIQFGEEKRGMKPLLTWGEIEIPTGVLDRGYVHDQKQLTAVLKECKAKTNATFVRVSLPKNERTCLKLKSNVRRQPKKSVVCSNFVSKKTSRFRLGKRFLIMISSRRETTDKTLRVVVAAYARETILNYFDACNEAGLIPLSFEVEAQAMVRSVLPSAAAGAHMLVDFGKTRTGVGIVLDGVLMYTSTIDFGGNQLSEVLRKVHGQITEGELTTIKNTQGLIKGCT
jgi:Tfp pilus assembly PilM family ATPase